MITQISALQAFSGVYYNKADKKALTYDEKIALASLGENVMSDTYVKDYDFDFGKVKNTKDGKGIFVKITLDGDSKNYKRAFVILKDNYESMANALNTLKQKVYEYKKDIYKTMDDPLEEDLYY